MYRICSGKERPVARLSLEDALCIPSLESSQLSAEMADKVGTPVAIDVRTFRAAKREAPFVAGAPEAERGNINSDSRIEAR